MAGREETAGKPRLRNRKESAPGSTANEDRGGSEGGLLPLARTLSADSMDKGTLVARVRPQIQQSL